MPPAEDIIGASFGFLVEAFKFPGQEAFKAAQDVTGVAKSIFTFGFDFASFTLHHLFYLPFWGAIIVVLAQGWRGAKQVLEAKLHSVFCACFRWRRT